MVRERFYEQVLPLAREELAAMERAPERELARLRMESVEIEENDELGPHLAITFRDPERPECLFGWRWSWMDDPKPDEVEFAASLVRINLEEDLLAAGYGLPAECVSDGVTWF